MLVPANSGIPYTCYVICSQDGDSLFGYVQWLGSGNIESISVSTDGGGGFMADLVLPSSVWGDVIVMGSRPFTLEAVTV